jgi:hypothetical protein
MTGRVLSETAERAAGEVESGGLDRVLVGDQDGGATRNGGTEVVDDRRHPAGHFTERFRGEGEVVRVGEIGLEFSGESVRKVLPRHSGPTCPEAPFREAVVDPRYHVQCPSDLIGGLRGPLQRRRHQSGSRGDLAEIGGGGRGLGPAGDAEAESGEVGVDHVGGIVNLAVADQEESGEHGAGV